MITEINKKSSGHLGTQGWTWSQSRRGMRRADLEYILTNQRLKMEHTDQSEGLFTWGRAPASLECLSLARVLGLWLDHIDGGQPRANLGPCSLLLQPIRGQRYHSQPIRRHNQLLTNQKSVYIGRYRPIRGHYCTCLLKAEVEAARGPRARGQGARREVE